MSNTIDYYKELFIRYRNKGLLLDANLLLLYVVGSYRPNLIQRFKRTQIFAPEDYTLLVNIIQSFNQVITTPHILTEVSNLSNQLDTSYKPEYFSTFCKVITMLNENPIAAKQICHEVGFNKFGLTDMGIVYLAAKSYLVLTMDFPLTGYLKSKNIDVINFNHIRTLNWTHVKTTR